MAVVEAGFEESLSLVLKGSQFRKYFPMLGTTERGDKEHKETLINLPTGFGESLIFRLLPFVLDSVFN